MFITHATKKKIRILINKALFIAFVRAGHTKNYKYTQVALLLEYIFNFFIDPQKEKINRDDIFSACEKVIYESLPPLPDSPSDVLSSIKIKLSVALPISFSNDTALVARALKAHYKFDLLLLHTSFKNLPYQTTSITFQKTSEMSFLSKSSNK